MTSSLIEEQIANAESALLASIVASSNDAISATTLDGEITSWNRAAERMYGYNAEQIIGMSVSLLAPASGDEMTEILAKIRAGDRVEQFETTRRRRDGTSLPLSLTVSPIHDDSGAIVGASSIARGIASTRRTEANGALMIAIVNSSHDAIIGKTLGGEIVTWNHAAERMYGYSADEIVGRSVGVLIPEGDVKMLEILGKIRKGDRIEHHQTSRRRKDGTLVPVSLTISPICDEAGAVIGASSIVRDITALVQSERLLREASEYSRSLIEASLDPLVTISAEGKITDVNEATTKVTGVGRERLIGTDVSDYFTEPEKAREGYRRAFSEGSITDYPLTIRHRDGALRSVLYNASVYRDAAGDVLGVFAAARDVTAQRRAEAVIAEQRDKELNRLAELERFQRLTVGRELKMIELKRQIEELTKLVAPDAAEPA